MGLGAVAAAGVALAAVSAISAGEAQKSNLDYQAQIANNNATIAQQNAAYAGAAGSEAATQQSLKGAAIGARIKTAQAANGVDVNSGSAVNVQASQRESSQLDTEQVHQNALLQAYGYKVAASNDQAQGALDEAGGNEAETAGFLNAGSSLLGGASSISTKFGGGGFDFSDQTSSSNYGSGIAGTTP